MAKSAFIIFLSFCFLLLSGSSHLRLPVSFSKTGTVLTNHSVADSTTSQVILSKQHSIQLPSAGGNETDIPNGIEPEDDDDNSETSRKYLELTSYFLHLFQATVIGDAHCYCKASLPACMHFARLASQKHILNRVIRI